MNTRMQRLGGAIVAMMCAAPAGLACLQLVVPPMGTTEQAPCGGDCNHYSVCPPDETCPGGYWTGFDSCLPTVFVVSCYQYTGGWANDGLCCTGGTPTTTPPTATSVTRPKVFLTPKTVCGWWQPVPADD